MNTSLNGLHSGQEVKEEIFKELSNWETKVSTMKWKRKKMGGRKKRSKVCGNVLNDLHNIFIILEEEQEEVRENIWCSNGWKVHKSMKAITL